MHQFLHVAPRSIAQYHRDSAPCSWHTPFRYLYTLMRSSLSPVFSKFTLPTAREGLPHTTPRPGALCWDTPGNPFQLWMPIQSPTRKSSHISPKPPAPLTPAACGFAPVPRPTPAPLTCQKEEERGKHYTPAEVPLRPAAPPHLLHAGCMRRATVRLIAGAGQYGGGEGAGGI